MDINEEELTQVLDDMINLKHYDTALIILKLVKDSNGLAELGVERSGNSIAEWC
jgi:hypothetical protein